MYTCFVCYQLRLVQLLPALLTFVYRKDGDFKNKCFIIILIINTQVYSNKIKDKTRIIVCQDVIPTKNLNYVHTIIMMCFKRIICHSHNKR